MASIKKFKQTEIVNQLRHIERTIQNPSNEDIDTTRSDNNYSLISQRSLSSYEYFLQRKSELHCMKRADVTLMCGWIITFPQTAPKSEQTRFFQNAYEFLNSRYGEENCIQAIVHQDESGQPHLHYCFVPVVPDAKHNGEKICCNELINRTELRNFHPALQKYLYDNQLDINIISGITKKQGGNRTVADIKKERKYNYSYEHERRW